MRYCLPMIVSLCLLVSCKNNDNYLLEQDEYSPEVEEFLKCDLSSDSIVNQYIMFFEEVKNFYGLCLAYRAKGDNFRNNYQLQKAVEAHIKSLEYAEKLHSIEQAMCHNTLATDYYQMNLLDKVVEEHFKVLTILDNYCDTLTIVKKNESLSFSSIGNIQTLMGYYSEAAASFKRAMDIEVELKNETGKALLFLSIGKNFEYQKMYDSALYYYQYAMFHNNLAESEVGVAITQCNIGKIKLIKGDTVTAIRNFYESIHLLKKNHYFWQLLDNYQCLFEIYLCKNKKHLVQYYLEEIGKIASQTGAMQQKIIFLYDNYLVNKNNNNWQLALDYLEQTKAVKYELEKRKNLLNIQQLRVCFEHQKNTKIIEAQNKRYIEQRDNNVLLSTFAILALIILALLGIIIFQYRKRVRVLSNINQSQNRLFSIISHDLKNPAIAQKTAIKQLIDNFDNLEKGTLQKYFLELYRSADSQIELLFNLLNWAKLQIGEISAKKGYFDISNVFREELKFVKLILKNKKISVINKIPDKLIGYSDKIIFSTIVRNLLSNAIKFSRIGGEILLQCDVHDDYYSIIIRDYGVGMGQSQLYKIMKTNENFTMSGTAGETGSGIGLIVCKQLAAINSEHLNIVSKEGIGTTIYLTVQMNE
ncbi:MAG: HAMP domain-containing histidine kinase [Bacteroidales bacterium]|jgi:signal transduction histidine kinase|nr:HAMP domain-containing histidine kinase [Bacteroidales bacterium]